MNLQTVTIYRVLCQAGNHKPDAFDCLSSREAVGMVAELVRDLRRDGFRRDRSADAEFDNRFFRGRSQVRIWITEHTEYADEFFADDYAERE